jgi:hypothetical protein
VKTIAIVNEAENGFETVFFYASLDRVIESLRQAGYTVFPTERVETAWLNQSVDNVALESFRGDMREYVRRSMASQLARMIAEKLQIAEYEERLTHRFTTEVSVVYTSTDELKTRFKDAP